VPFWCGRRSERRNNDAHALETPGLRRLKLTIGTVRETKAQEFRVGLTPSGVRAYSLRGNEVAVETGAGEGAGFTDHEYAEAGGRIHPDAASVFAAADMIVKVKEPLAPEFEMLREGQILFTYLHLAAAPEVARILMERKVTAVAYETIETADGQLPCLTPMSQIAGRLSVQEGAKYLEKTFGGRGVLLGGVPGVARGKVGIIGGGVVGINACKVAVGLGAEVTILDISASRLAYLDDIFSTHITTLYSNDENVERVLRESDVVIGAVLVHGGRTPRLIRKDHLALMKKGAVIVDVAVDQGGCAETTRPTTHEDPVYVVDGIVHYCVANMPGALALTSTRALTGTTRPYGLLIAQHGAIEACRRHPALRRGLNTHAGLCVYESVAEACGLPFTPVEEVLR
jgi:alanine dehydrogenase